MLEVFKSLQKGKQDDIMDEDLMCFYDVDIIINIEWILVYIFCICGNIILS